MSEEAASEQEERPRVKTILRGIPGTVLNQQKGRKYLIANPADENGGLQYHLDCGYHRVNHKRDPERLLGGAEKSNGDVTWKGQVLTWIEIEKYQAMQDEIAALRSNLAHGRRAPGGVDRIVDATGHLASDISRSDNEE